MQKYAETFTEKNVNGFTESEIKEIFIKIKQENAADKNIALLHTGKEQTYIITEDKENNIIFLKLDIGTEKTGFTYFHHSPPTPDEVENAINVVEDELTKIFSRITKQSVLYTKDEQVKEIAILAGVKNHDEMILSRNDMESLFSRLAALSMGRSVKTDIIPVDSSFSAGLLILREIMHHLGYEFINIF
jgi:exopolyphosphatase/pppGpp-phosphohydrolase